MRFSSLPAYPSGWFHVAWTDGVGSARPQRVHALGTQFEIRRDPDGTATVQRARCPVCNSTSVTGPLRCVEHGTLATHPTRERFGRIFLWHDGNPRGGLHPVGAPTWELPEHLTGSELPWLPAVRDGFEVRSHVQEVMENCVDQVHFHVVHGLSTVPRMTSTFDGTRIRSTATTSVIGRRVGVVGIELPIHLEICVYGLGFETIRTTVGTLFDTLVIESITPVNTQHVRIETASHVHLSAVPPLGWLLRHIFGRIVSTDVAKDRRIWEHKRYVERPLIVRGDGAIGRYRKWTRQFYPPVSATGVAV